MSLNYIAVDGCTLEFQKGGIPNSAITITPGQLSTKVKADGKAVYLTLNFTITGYTASSLIKPNWVAGSGTGQGSIQASAEYVKIEGNKALLEGDVSAEITITGQSSSGSSTYSDTTTEVVKITSAGQTKAKGA